MVNEIYSNKTHSFVSISCGFVMSTKKIQLQSVHLTWTDV